MDGPKNVSIADPSVSTYERQRTNHFQWDYTFFWTIWYRQTAVTSSACLTNHMWNCWTGFVHSQMVHTVKSKWSLKYAIVTFPAMDVSFTISIHFMLSLITHAWRFEMEAFYIIFNLLSPTCMVVMCIRYPIPLPSQFSCYYDFCVFSYSIINSGKRRNTHARFGIPLSKLIERERGKQLVWRTLWRNHSQNWCVNDEESKRWTTICGIYASHFLFFYITR